MSVNIAESLSATDGDTPRLDGTILVVDDDFTSVAIVEEYLREAGYRSIRSTIESTLAMEMIRSTRPDIVLLDINMPVVSGLDILKSIRSNAITRRIPVLMLTASRNVDIKTACLEEGATDFLNKPVDPVDLLPRVRNAVQSKLFQDQLVHHGRNMESKYRKRIAELEREVADLRAGQPRP